MEQNTVSTRQHWMKVLSRAGKALLPFQEQLLATPHEYIRAPETGMVMVRGRAGGTGMAFNVGETTVSRCVVRLTNGCEGYSYVLGRNMLVARLAAIADALLQGEQQVHWLSTLIQPLEEAQQQARHAHQQDVATSKVDFFTMVRGD
ncbi:phosphonate C-P lyase system protein PhnG [Paenalcaligenes sp. Me131]|uniref:phosphonate C-P lyase system protein PhnG n=1 Tax=Paenalcaligenes sp. Me131 TaxID=3392636 RepID=UPI003D2E1A88